MREMPRVNTYKEIIEFWGALNGIDLCEEDKEEIKQTIKFKEIYKKLLTKVKRNDIIRL